MRTFHDWYLTGISMRGDSVRVEFCPPNWISRKNDADVDPTEADMRSAVIVVLGGVSHFICADLLLGNTVFSVDIGEVTQARADEIAGRFMGLATDAYFGSRDDMTKAVLKAADAGKRFVDMSSSYGAVLCAICDSAREIETETTSV